MKQGCLDWYENMGCLFIVVLVVFLVLLGWHTIPPDSSLSQFTPLITLSNIGFSQKSITLPQAENMYIRNTSTTAYALCLGQNQQCNRSATLPGYLVAPGITIQTGHTHALSFTIVNSYEITLTGLVGRTLTISTLLVTVQINRSETPSIGSFGSGGAAVGSYSTGGADADVTASSAGNDGGGSSNGSSSNGGGDDSSGGSSSGGGGGDGSSSGGSSGGGGGGGE